MIYVTFQKEGIHCYPAAATDPKLKTGDEYDVSFLAEPHRHIFHFKVSIEVFTDDRDIEFIQFKRWLENQYKDGILSMGHKSCEMLSDDLYQVISKKYPNRDIVIDVSEDGENGSVTTYSKDAASATPESDVKVSYEDASGKQEEAIVPPEFVDALVTAVKNNIRNSAEAVKQAKVKLEDITTMPDFKDTPAATDETPKTQEQKNAEIRNMISTTFNALVNLSKRK